MIEYRRNEMNRRQLLLAGDKKMGELTGTEKPITEAPPASPSSVHSAPAERKNLLSKYA
jgi:hypothetical protein